MVNIFISCFGSAPLKESGFARRNGSKTGFFIAGGLPFYALCRKYGFAIKSTVKSCCCREKQRFTHIEVRMFL
ncbi:hypothetical protein AABM17_226 [Neisseria musculi]|uniref:Uncharacterized protein n=1 Tax=Neisseria musculi TaxID=1815583 RepID=A0A7H1MCJ7_9NEIS|nr:hypothetical protein H7A79_0226 [Neisseria musculi]